MEHFLEDAVDADAFAKYLKPDYLRRVFAETKLLRGVGAEEQWYKMLNAAERQRILRLFEVLRDSIRSALESGVPATASARADLARSSHAELLEVEGEISGQRLARRQFARRRLRARRRGTARRPLSEPSQA